MTTRRSACFGLGGNGRVALAAFGPAAHRRPIPERPITLVVPFPAGGSTDLVARVVPRR